MKALHIGSEKNMKVVQVDDPTKKLDIDNKIYKLMPSKEFVNEIIDIKRQNSRFKLKVS